MTFAVMQSKIDAILSKGGIGNLEEMGNGRI